MGLDMYLTAEIYRNDPDPRAQACFAAIDEMVQAFGPADNQEISLCDVDAILEDRPFNPRLVNIQNVIAAQFPVVYQVNHWIGAAVGRFRIQLPLFYWRKANAIHGWFVHETQDGVDECKRSEVTRENLFDLRKLLKAVEADQGNAALLPPQEGFFFGGAYRDAYYWRAVLDTREMLDRLCERGLTEGTKIYYQASW